MNANVTRFDNATVISVKDDLAGEDVEAFANRASSCVGEGVFNLVVDFGQVGAIDSAGLEALLDLKDRCEEHFGSLKLCGLDETLVRVLEITRLMRRFEAFEDVDAAVRSFA